jgi:hypothetical protein
LAAAVAAAAVTVTAIIVTAVMVAAGLGRSARPGDGLVGFAESDGRAGNGKQSAGDRGKGEGAHHGRLLGGQSGRGTPATRQWPPRSLQARRNRPPA